MQRAFALTLASLAAAIVWAVVIAARHPGAVVVSLLVTGVVVAIFLGARVGPVRLAVLALVVGALFGLGIGWWGVGIGALAFLGALANTLPIGSRAASAP